MMNSQRVLNDIIKTSQMGINGINVVMDKTRQSALRQALKVQRREYSDIIHLKSPFPQGRPAT